VTFVTGLKSKLVTEALTRRPGLSLLQFILVVVIGISSTILLIFTGARAVAAVLGALSLLRLTSGSMQKKNLVITARMP
jgi:predicted cation transporter